MSNGTRALGLVAPALVVGPVTTVLLWSEGPLLALLAAPFVSSAIVAGLALCSCGGAEED